MPHFAPREEKVRVYTSQDDARKLRCAAEEVWRNAQLTEIGDPPDCKVLQAGGGTAEVIRTEGRPHIIMPCQIPVPRD